MESVDLKAPILVTGASRGIGHAIFQLLARSEHSVIGLSRTAPYDQEGSAAPVRFHPVWQRLDLSDVVDVEKYAASLISAPVRALVLSAVDYGAAERHSADAISAHEWQKVVTTNCVGQCLLVSSLLPKLTASSPGIVINISSDVALLPGPGRSAYAASKAGLHAMLRAVAAENSKEHLRVYQLVPTFQLLTEGIRRRRPVGFEFSGYANPEIIAQVVLRILSLSHSSTDPGTYLIQRDGTITRYPEATQL